MNKTCESCKTDTSDFYRHKDRDGKAFFLCSRCHESKIRMGTAAVSRPLKLGGYTKDYRR